MTDVEVFQFPATGQQIRMLIRNGEPLFCHADVCKGLQHSNPSVALRLVDEDDRVEIDVRETDIPTLNRAPINPMMWFLTESGFYTLAIASQAPGAKPFKRWITHDVLPAIRKTGRYEALDANTARHEIPQSFADALQLAANQARAIEKQNARIAALEPRAAQADQHRAADGLVAIGDFANKVKAWAKREHGVKVLHKEVWDFLGDIDLLIRGKTVRKNQPTAFAIERDFIRVSEGEHPTNHGMEAHSTSRLTPAGEGWAWDRAVKRIAAHGSLKPSTDIETSPRS